MFTQRINYPYIKNSLQSAFITAILGPRRVGKSFLIQNFAEQHQNYTWAFFNMDDMQQRNNVRAQQLATMISEATQQVIGQKDKIWVVIDEAQKCPELFDQIKILYDSFKKEGMLKFIITGSAILSLHKLSTETLAGRIQIHHLNPFNLRESALVEEPQLPLNSLLDLITDNQPIELLKALLINLEPFKPLLETHLDQHLIWGGFPELINLNSSTEKITYLNNYLQTYLEKDIQPIESISDLNTYRKMLDIIAEQTGSVREDKKILQALNCSRETLKKYRGYLEATLLYQDIYPYIDSSLKRLVKSPKGYLLNNGLVSVLTGLIDSIILKKTGLIGHRLENWFLNEIKTWAARTALRSTIFYWRTSGGAEVDFVVVKKPYVYPFEITNNNQINQKKFRNLINFLQQEPKATWGYFIYNGKFRIDEKNRIIFIPCWAIG